MALVIYEQTRCPLCGDVLREDDTIELFPPLVSDAADPLAIFNDAAVHSACLNRDPRRDRVRELVRELTGGSSYSCEICGEPITDPDDYFTFGVLTTDKNDPLHQFNRRTFHVGHLATWVERETASRLIRERLKETGSPGLSSILRRLDSGL